MISYDKAQRRIEDAETLAERERVDAEYERLTAGEDDATIDCLKGEALKTLTSAQAMLCAKMHPANSRTLRRAIVEYIKARQPHV